MGKDKLPERIPEGIVFCGSSAPSPFDVELLIYPLQTNIDDNHLNYPNIWHRNFNGLNLPDLCRGSLLSSAAKNNTRGDVIVQL